MVASFVGLLWVACTGALSVGGSSCWENNQAKHWPADLRSNSSNLEELAWGLEDAARLEAFLDLLLVARPPGSEQAAEVREAIAGILEEMGWQVEDQQFTATSPFGEEVQMSNLVAMQSPTMPRQLAIACHLDSKRDPVGFLGATDSAVPCALMIDIAASVGRLTRRQSELGLSLIFLDGEEQLHEHTLFGPDGLYGSKEMAVRLANTSYSAQPGPWCQDGPATEMSRLDLFLLLDLIGAPGPTFRNVIDPTTGECDELFSELVAIEDALTNLCPSCNPPPRQFENQCTEEDPVVDDQVPFLEEGLRRALHVVANPFPQVWHTMADDKSHLDWEAIGRTAAVLRVFVAEFLHVTL